MDVVLVAPEIPQNTGSIARMCAATGVRLHLVAPLGFTLDDKYLKRAGLDYWNDVCVGVHKDFETFLSTVGGRRMWFLSKKAKASYAEVEFGEDDVFVFGSESKGLPEDLLERFGAKSLRIPIRPAVRSLNLSAATHIVVYHALSQLNFPGILPDD